MDLLEPAVLSLPSPGTDFVGTDSLFLGLPAAVSAGQPFPHFPYPSLPSFPFSLPVFFLSGKDAGRDNGREGRTNGPLSHVKARNHFNLTYQ